MKILQATSIAAVLLATVSPASAHCCGGGGSNWGAAVGAGILGGILGGALQQQPQQTVIVTSPAPAPSPILYLWCPPLARFYGQVATCPVQWQLVQVQR